ncbi:MAG: Xaa-Pro dipeptidase [Arenimonas sp.]|nr:Xaa-Pro dipeptidase [Arenimonas sp.]
MANFQEHLAFVTKTVNDGLAKTGFDCLIIASGIEKMRFLDDCPYPFKANPQFKYWAPLCQHPNSWIAYSPDQKPILVYYQPDDYWHVPPSAPHGDWVEHFDIRIINEPGDAVKHLPNPAQAAIIGEADAALGAYIPNNPKMLLDYLHYHRAYKTPYELAQMRKAQAKAVRGHQAAEQAFRAHGSEAQINAAFLAAASHTDSDVPYNNIVALNENGATLHYQYKSFNKPAHHRSLLIDAGAEHNGYAADITRTYGNGFELFEQLISAVEKEQLALCAQVKAGLDYRELHLQCHLRLGGVLRDLGIVDMDPGSMLEKGVSSVFYPHGLGHPIGLQVHDVAGFSDENGVLIPRPDGQPFLRMTRTLAPGMVVTIEPGLYFIPTLLAKLKQRPESKLVNWQKVEQLMPYGGVRIEDEVHCTDDEPENLSRDAFAAL